MVAFPLGKLLSLAMKQVARPIASQLKNAAKRSPFMRRYICSPPAQGTVIDYLYMLHFVGVVRGVIVRGYICEVMGSTALYKLD